jgi:hypothetical protein
LDEEDRLEIEETADTDRVEEKQEDIGVARRVGDEDSEPVLRFDIDAQAMSSSVDVLSMLSAVLSAPRDNKVKEEPFVKVPIDRCAAA